MYLENIDIFGPSWITRARKKLRCVGQNITGRSVRLLRAGGRKLRLWRDRAYNRRQFYRLGGQAFGDFGLGQR